MFTIILILRNVTMNTVSGDQCNDLNQRDACAQLWMDTETTRHTVVLQRFSAPNTKALPRGLCFSFHLSLIFVNKTAPHKSIFPEPTWRLPKGLEKISTVPLSDGVSWSRALNVDLDMGFAQDFLSPAVFHYSSSGIKYNLSHSHANFILRLLLQCMCTFIYLFTFYLYLSSYLYLQPYLTSFHILFMFAFTFIFL